MEEKFQIARKNVNGILPLNVLLIPFAYQNHSSYEDTINMLLKDTNDLQWKYSSIAAEHNELFEHIYHLIDSDKTFYENEENTTSLNSCIGKCFELIQSKSSISYIGVNKEWIEIYRQGAKIGTYRLKTIKMILFETGIGFLLMDIEYLKSVTLTELAKFNSIIKILKSSKYTFYFVKEFELALNKEDIVENIGNNPNSYIKVEYNKKINYIPIDKININPNTTENNFLVHKLIKQSDGKYRLKYKTEYCFDNLIDNLLSGIHVTTFFNNIYNKSNHKFYPKKAHTFSSVLVDNFESDSKLFDETFYLLRKGYRDKYLPVETEISIENNPQIQRPYKNSYWGVSRDSCVNLCHLTKNEKSDRYFCGNYANNLGNYLYIYLIALHQYYGLLNITEQTSKFNYYASNYVDNDDEFNKIIALRNDKNFFYLKCIYNEISHISHQSQLYNMMINELGVRLMQDQLHFEMDRIINIITHIREEESQRRMLDLDKQKKQIESRKKKNFKIISIAGGLFTFVQAFSAALQTWDITATLRTEFKGYELLNAVLTVVGTILLGLIIWMIWRTLDRED